MNEVIRNRTIRPSSRLETSKNYKIDTKNVSSGDTLVVNIDHETKSFKKSFRFKGADVVHKNSISFRVNDFGDHIDISWSGAQPNDTVTTNTKRATINQPRTPTIKAKVIQNQKPIEKISYAHNKSILKEFYEQSGIENKFDRDSAYLEKAFNDINKLWQNNFDQIETVNYLMIAEAPLWGQENRYIYNPHTNNSQFFYRSDLGDILNRHITNKRAFIAICNEIGLLVVDISPFALNPKDTAINYRQLRTKAYRQLVSLTIPTYLAQKIDVVKEKKSSDIKTFFRYARIKGIFQDIISEVLIDNDLIKHGSEIGYISQEGGGVDKAKLRQILQAIIE